MAIRSQAMTGVANYDVAAVSLENGISFREARDRTQQQFKDEADINVIVRRFGLTGQMPETVRVPHSGDFTGIVDFQGAMNAVVQAREAFMELPAELRARFDNSPQKLMVFVADGNNRAEAERLGLINKPPEVTRDAVKAIDELAAKLTAPKV